MASWKTNFNSVVIVNNMIAPNNYEVNIEFAANTENSANISVFVQRLRTFFELLDGTTIIGTSEPLLETLMEKLEGQWILIPGIPYDAIIAETLHAKVTAFSEGNVDITKVSVTSALTGRVTLDYEVEFPYSEIESKVETAEIQPWYFQNNTDTVGSGEPVEWDDFGLSFEDEEPVTVASKKMGLKIIDGGRPKGL